MNSERGSSIFLKKQTGLYVSCLTVYSYFQWISPLNAHKEKITQLDFAPHGCYYQLKYKVSRKSIYRSRRIRAKSSAKLLVLQLRSENKTVLIHVTVFNSCVVAPFNEANRAWI